MTGRRSHVEKDTETEKQTQKELMLNVMLKEGG